MRFCGFHFVIAKNEFLEQLAQRPEKKILVLNKVDIAKKEPLLALAQELSAKVDFAEIYFISALTGDGVPEQGTDDARRTHQREVQAVLTRRKADVRRGCGAV